MMRGIGDLWARIRSRGKGEFLVSPHYRVTYKHLGRRIQAACAAFDRVGLSQGDRLTIALGDEREASAVFLAALLDGLVPAMLSPLASHERRAAIARVLDARLVVDDETPLAQPEGKGLFARLRGSANAGRAPRLPDPGPDDLAYILFTSGTTAAPRGVEVTHKNLFSQFTTLHRLFGYEPGSRIFNATPLSHTDGLVQGPLLAASAGATLLRPGSFEVSKLAAWLDFLRGETATHMIANPTLLSLICQMAPERDYFDPQRFKGILSTGGALPRELWDQVEEAFGVRLWNVYGMTETVADALYAGDHPEMGARGTIGCPVDCEARVAGGSHVGELELKGSNISPGYWRDEDRTAISRTPDGWFRTGDVVERRAEDGAYEFKGRIKLAINQGAVTIYPEEIDEALMSHPDVLQSVTVGLADDDFEETAVAAVVATAQVSSDVLMAYCSDRLEPLKRPKRIVLMDDLPKTGSDKVDLPALRSLLSRETPRDAVAQKTPEAHSAVLAIAADVFNVPRQALDLESSSDSVAGWDSFNHLRLMMSVEQQLGASLSTKDIIQIRSLRGLVEKVEASI